MIKVDKIRLEGHHVTALTCLSMFLRMFFLPFLWLEVRLPFVLAQVFFAQGQFSFTWKSGSFLLKAQGFFGLIAQMFVFLAYRLLRQFYNLPLLRHFRKHLVEWKTKLWLSLKCKLLYASLILVMSEFLFQKPFLFRLTLTFDDWPKLHYWIHFRTIWRNKCISISSRANERSYVT